MGFQGARRGTPGRVRLGGFGGAARGARHGWAGSAWPGPGGVLGGARCGWAGSAWLGPGGRLGARAAAGPVRLALICSHGSNGAHARMVCGMVRDMVRGRTVRGPRFVRHGK